MFTEVDYKILELLLHILNGSRRAFFFIDFFAQ